MRRLQLDADELADGKQQLIEYIEWLVATEKARRKSGNAWSTTRRKRIVAVVCERWMRYVMRFGPPVAKHKHKRWKYAPDTYQLKQLSDVLLGEWSENL